MTFSTHPITQFKYSVLKHIVDVSKPIAYIQFCDNSVIEYAKDYIPHAQLTTADELFDMPNNHLLTIVEPTTHVAIVYSDSSVSNGTFDHSANTWHWTHSP